VLREREQLDRYVMTFPKDAPRGYTWAVVKSEDRLADERLNMEVSALKVKRSEERARVTPPGVVLPEGLKRKLRSVRVKQRSKQQSLFVEESDVDKDGRPVRR
jgi:hypothetical protein